MFVALIRFQLTFWWGCLKYSRSCKNGLVITAYLLSLLKVCTPPLQSDVLSDSLQCQAASRLSSVLTCIWYARVGNCACYWRINCQYTFYEISNCSLECLSLDFLVSVFRALSPSPHRTQVKYVYHHQTSLECFSCLITWIRSCQLSISAGFKKLEGRALIGFHKIIKRQFRDRKISKNMERLLCNSVKIHCT